MGCFGSKAEPAKPEPGSVAFGPSARAGVATGVDEVRSTPTAKAAAEAAGEDQAAQEQAAKEAFDREDDRTPEERETFKQVLPLPSTSNPRLVCCSRLFAKGSRCSRRRRASSR